MKSKIIIALSALISTTVSWAADQVKYYKSVGNGEVVLIKPSKPESKSVVKSESVVESKSVVKSESVVEIEETIIISEKTVGLTTPYFEIIGMGGAATLNADSSSITWFDNQVDTLHQTNADDLQAWTVQLGLGYMYPLLDAKKYSNTVQWFTAIQPQINAYYLQGDIDGYVHMFDIDSSPFNNQKYTVDLQSTRLMFDLALTVASWKNWSVYALAGIGPSWNNVSYDANANPELCVGATSIDDETSTSFAYEFGGGVTYAINQRVGVSLEYLYTGIDDISLGDDASIGSTSVSNVDAQEFDLSSQSILLGLRVAF